MQQSPYPSINALSQPLLDALSIGGSGGYANYGSYLEDLVGARLALSPDRDAPGLEYMSNFLRDFSSQVKGWYLAGTQSLWKNPSGGMDIGDDITDRKFTKEQILEKVLTPENYQQISTLAETSSSKRVEGADNLSALYQHLSAESIKQEVEAIFDRHLSQLNVEAELTALSSKLRLPKQSIEKIYNELELAANASADKFEIDKGRHGARPQHQPCAAAAQGLPVPVAWS